MDILQVAIKLSNTNVTNTLVKVLNKKYVQKFITDLNTKIQLFEYGEDSRGVELAAIGGGYAPSTIKIKSRKGQPSNRVTLKDTGDFHKSFKILVKSNANFSITSDPNKNGVDLHDRWGDDIEGLQPENVIKAINFLEKEFYKQVLR